MKCSSHIMFLTVIFSLLFSGMVFAEVPVPWGTKLVRSDTTVNGSGEEHKIATYETKASKQDLSNYYLREMSNRGYSLFMKGEQNIVFNKGEELVMIVFSPSLGEKNTFMISTAYINTKYGSYPYDSSSACESIPSVPVYPGSRCMNSTRVKSGDSRLTAYSVEAPVGEVFDFYRSQMSTYGWRLENEVDLENVVLDSINDQQQIRISPEQEKAMRDFYKGAKGASFIDRKGSKCFVHVADNPVVRGEVLINLVYDEKANK